MSPVPPAWIHLRPADYRVMPWKNGLGTTTEIAVEPAGAALDAFTWRLSVADLAASGPFSTFPGYDRIIVQTEGEPMTLIHEGRGRRRLTALAPYRFDGAWSTRGELAGASARDFNVIALRDRVRASAGVHALWRGRSTRVCAAVEVQVVHAFRGAITVHGDGGDVELDPGDTLIVAGGELEIGGSAGTEGPPGEDALAFLVAFATEK